MSSRHVADHRGLEIIVRSSDSVLDEIVLECPDLTWNQLFVVLDRLSQEGTLTMSPDESQGTRPVCGPLPMPHADALVNLGRLPVVTPSATW